MKILVVCQYYYPEPFRVTDICEELVKRGHKITVLTGLPNYPEGKVLKEYKKKEHRDEVRNGVRVIRCNEHGRGKGPINLLWNYYSFAISGKRMIEKLDKDFDLVFVNQLSPVIMAWPGIRYAKKYGKKCILYCYDLWPASLTAGGIKNDSFIYRHFDRVSRKIYSQMDHICVTSKDFIKYLETTHNINRNKISYLPQYCEDLFTTIKGQPHDGLNFVFAGNIGKMQSVDTIIKAANLIKDRKDIKIYIVGDGRDLNNCKKLSENLGTSNVVFYGRKPVEEMYFFYAIADAMIVTLRSDDLISKTIPGKVPSYLAAGKPIIGAIDGSCYDLILENNIGLACRSCDYKNLAMLFREFDSKSAIQMASNARKLYEKQFNKESFFDSLLKEFASFC